MAVLVGAFFTRRLSAGQIEKLSGFRKFTRPKFLMKIWLRPGNHDDLLLRGLILATALIVQSNIKHAWSSCTRLRKDFRRYFLQMRDSGDDARLFALFNLGMYLSGIIPSLLFGTSAAECAVSFREFCLEYHFFYRVSADFGAAVFDQLQFKNFLVPAGSDSWFGFWESDDFVGIQLHFPV